MFWYTLCFLTTCIMYMYTKIDIFKVCIPVLCTHPERDILSGPHSQANSWLDTQKATTGAGLEGGN